MLFAMVITMVMSSPILVWLFWIRPYCVRNGMGYTPGAGWETTMWVDWQEARELAVTSGEGKMILACRVFLGVKLVFLFFGLVGVVAAIAGR